MYYLLSVFSQQNWNSQRLFPFVICLILIVSSSSRYREQEMIVTIFMSIMESLSAILHVNYTVRFNVFSIYGRYTHNYSVSFCNFKLTIIFVNAVVIYHIFSMFTISLVMHIYTVYYIIIHIPTLRNGRCLHHLFVVGIVESRLCPK